MWAPQYDDLYDMARIIGPDLPGHGASDPPDGAISIGLMAQQCADLLDNLGISEPIVVCGMSMGGYIAFEFYRQFPDRVKGLILTATRSLPDSEEAKSGRNAAISKIKQKGLESFNQTMLPKPFSPTVLEDDEELVSFVYNLMNQTSEEGAIAALKAMKERVDSTPLLPRIQVPTVIIHGEEDQIIPVAEAQAMQEAIPQADLYIIENAGHMVNLEQPDIFNGLVAEFLSDLLDLEE
jgi:pimeloyl-ACP methyl ester carboxylesterase